MCWGRAGQIPTRETHGFCEGWVNNLLPSQYQFFSSSTMRKIAGTHDFSPCGFSHFRQIFADKFVYFIRGLYSIQEVKYDWKQLEYCSMLGKVRNTASKITSKKDRKYLRKLCLSVWHTIMRRLTVPARGTEAAAVLVFASERKDTNRCRVDSSRVKHTDYMGRTKRVR